MQAHGQDGARAPEAGSLNSLVQRAQKLNSANFNFELTFNG